MNYLDISGICPSHATRICQPGKMLCSNDIDCPSSRLCCRDGCGNMTCELPGRFGFTLLDFTFENEIYNEINVWNIFF